MTKRMTIDELIALLSEERAGYEQSNQTTIVKNWGNGIKIAIKRIEENRAALEAGRGVLRFKPTDSFNWYCIHDDLDEEQFLRARMCGGAWHRLEFNFEGECKAFAESLGMDAEFMEDKDGT